MNQKRKRLSTVALVTDQIACERMIKAARLVADLNDTQLLVLTVQRPGAEADPEALDHLFRVAKEYGAKMTAEFAQDVMEAILRFCRRNKAISVVTGMPEGKHSVLSRLWRSRLAATFFTVSQRGQLQEVFDRTHHRELVHMASRVEQEQLA